MSAGENDNWLRALAGIPLPSSPNNCVPTLSPPRLAPEYRPLASIGSAQPNPLAGLFSSPLAGTVPSGLTPLASLGRLSAAVVAAPLYQAPTAAPAPPQWIYVTRRFDQLIDAIGIRQDEIDDGTKKLGRVVTTLNRYYWNHDSETLNASLVGSWAKQTRVRPFSDIDVMFVLPWEVYWRFEKRLGNKQSQLLQELRANLKVTYPRTDIRGDGQVVIVTVDGVTIEVVPTFRFDDGRLCICDTNEDGKYKWADPAAELQALEKANVAYNQNARQLTRLLKKWQIQKGVPIKAFELERLAIEFLEGWHNSTRDRFWYDWMMRDFFFFLIGRANGFIQMPGTGEWIAFGADWLTAAKAAYKDALAACAYEKANLEVKAGNAWKEIFGSAAPETVS